MNTRHLATAALAIGLLGCSRARTERYCRQAVEERTRNDPTRAFPTERFLAACRQLPVDHAQCTVPSFAGSLPVLAARECREAYLNPAFPETCFSAPSPRRHRRTDERVRGCCDSGNPEDFHGSNAATKENARAL